VAELTHLLVEDVNLATEVFTIRPKPWLMWNVKTGRERQLPLTPETRAMFAEAIGERKAGFVFVTAGVADGTKKRPTIAPPAAFRAAVERAITDLAVATPQAGERDRKRVVVAFCRAAGQTPEKTVREEFLKVTKKIGCPEYTRVHDLRHLFSSRAQ